MLNFMRWRQQTKDLFGLASHTQEHQAIMLYIVANLEESVLDLSFQVPDLVDLKTRTVELLRHEGGTKVLPSKMQSAQMHRFENLVTSGVDALREHLSLQTGDNQKAYLEQLLNELLKSVAPLTNGSQKEFKETLAARKLWFENSGFPDLRFEQDTTLVEIFGLLSRRLLTLLKDQMGLETETPVYLFEDLIGSRLDYLVAWSYTISRFDRIRTLENQISPLREAFLKQKSYQDLETLFLKHCEDYFTLMNKYVSRHARTEAEALSILKQTLVRRMIHHLRALSLQTDHLGVAQWLHQSLGVEMLGLSDAQRVSGGSYDLELASMASSFERQVFHRFTAKIMKTLKHSDLSGARASS